MKHLLKLVVLSVSLALLSGCVTITPNFSATQEFWGDKDGKVVGVAIAKTPIPAAYKQGNQGLLDVAINSAMATDLEAHLVKLEVLRIDKLADEVSMYLRNKGFLVKRIKSPIDASALKAFEKGENAPANAYFPKLDYRPLKAEVGIDKLVVLSLNQLGTIRSYYGFVPLNAPSGISSVSGQAINLSSNRLEWNHAVTQVVPNTEGEWDVPPDYPSLTKAVYTAYDRSRTMLYQQFAQ